MQTFFSSFKWNSLWGGCIIECRWWFTVVNCCTHCIYFWLKQFTSWSQIVLGRDSLQKFLTMLFLLHVFLVPLEKLFELFLTHFLLSFRKLFQGHLSSLLLGFVLIIKLVENFVKIPLGIEGTWDKLAILIFYYFGPKSTIF